MAGIYYVGLNEEQVNKFESTLKKIYDNLNEYENNVKNTER